MDFQKLLLGVGKSLSDDEVQALAFLCTDLLGKNPNSVDSCSDLFSLLMDEDLLSDDNPELLVELLLTIQRPVLLRDLGYPVQRLTSGSRISPYRKLLYELSENITVDELKQMKFLLKDIPRRKLEEKNALGVFLEMERMDFINENNLDCLEGIFNSVCRVLNEKIRRYKAEMHHRPRSSSLPSESNQIPTPFNRTGSFKYPAPQPPVASMNSCNITYDVSSAGNIPTAVTPQQGIEEKKASLESLSPLEIQPSESQNNVEDLDEYPMTRAKRGICVIVNNNDFSESRIPLKERVGTMIDEKALEKVFKWLGFDVKTYRDYEASKIQALFEHVAKMDHSQNDCLVCCVLSHGMEGGVYGVDGNTVLIKELMRPFTGQTCLSLVKKPKLFFIQACQGKNEQRPIQTDGPGDKTSNVCCDAKVYRESIPCAADFVVGMATLPDYVSYRERSNGTWYIQSLCQNLAKFVPRRMDLLSILTKVNDDVSKRTDDTKLKKQMPLPSFSLRKRMVFPVPEESPPIFK
ncbi:caspase-8 isoform X2 [Fundulus heteroclitus]|nr:caspase-8 isoform X2 [Fundulus heteroclitus]